MVKIQLGVIQAEFDFQDLKPKVEYVRELVSQTIRDVRTLTFELSPPMLYELGLQAALEWLAVNIRKQSGLEVEIAADGCDRVLDADRRVLLFRTCSELLLNVVKHADAKHARVDMRSDGDLIRSTFPMTVSVSIRPCSRMGLTPLSAVSACSVSGSNLSNTAVRLRSIPPQATAVP